MKFRNFIKKSNINDINYIFDKGSVKINYNYIK